MGYKRYSYSQIKEIKDTVSKQSANGITTKETADYLNSIGLKMASGRDWNGSNLATFLLNHGPKNRKKKSGSRIEIGVDTKQRKTNGDTQIYRDVILSLLKDPNLGENDAIRMIKLYSQGMSWKNGSGE